MIEIQIQNTKEKLCVKPIGTLSLNLFFPWIFVVFLIFYILFSPQKYFCLFFACFPFCWGGDIENQSCSLVFETYLFLSRSAVLKMCFYSAFLPESHEFWVPDLIMSLISHVTFGSSPLSSSLLRLSYLQKRKHQTWPLRQEERRTGTCGPISSPLLPISAQPMNHWAHMQP